jgi:hypothetical protein
LDDHSRPAYSEILADEGKETAAAFWTRANAYFADCGIRVQRVSYGLWMPPGLTRSNGPLVSTVARYSYQVRPRRSVNSRGPVTVKVSHSGI